MLIKVYILGLSFMITIKYQTHDGAQGRYRPNFLDEQVIKWRSSRFNAQLVQLRCGNSEHLEFENIITVNLSPTEYFVMEKVCCAGFEDMIINALTEMLKNK
jgi:hypothetical protein